MSYTVTLTSLRTKNTRLAETSCGYFPISFEYPDDRKCHTVIVSWSLQTIYREAPYFRLVTRDGKKNITEDIFVQLIDVRTHIVTDDWGDDRKLFKLKVIELSNLEIVEIIGNDEIYQHTVKCKDWNDLSSR